jgi:hypothetical protein
MEIDSVFKTPGIVEDSQSIKMTAEIVLQYRQKIIE